MFSASEMWYQVFLWALFSSMFVHIIATLIALVQLRKHKIGRWIPLGIFAMGVVSPITLGSVSSKFSEVQINKSLERKIVNISFENPQHNFYVLVEK